MSVARTDAVEAGSPLAAFRDAWMGDDPAAVARLFAAAGERRDVGFGVVARGRQEIAAAAAVYLGAFAERVLDLRPMSVGAGGWATEVDWSAVHDGEFRGLPPCRRRISFTGLSIGWLDDAGLLTIEKWYSDGASLTRNLGGRL